MNVQEMHLAFKIGVDKVDSLNYPDFQPNEIDFLLNQSQERFVKQRYGLNNTKGKSFESDQKRTDDLRAVIKNSIIKPLTYDSNNNISVNARFAQLPSDYWFAVNERVDLESLDCNGKTVTSVGFVRVINHDNFNIIEDDPFEEPTKDKVVRLMIGNNAELISANGVNIINYRLRYLRRPIGMNIDTNINCELADHTHNEIVNGAVLIALETIESKRTSSFLSVEKNNEE